MNLKALVLAIKREKHAHLKEAMVASCLFSQAYSARSLREALDICEKEQLVDIILATKEFPPVEMSGFLQEVRERKSAQDAACITVLDEKDSEAGSVTSTVLHGADGVLIAPFSVERLQEISKLAERVRRDRRLARHDKLIRFLMGSIKSSFDNAVTAIRGESSDTGRAIHDFRETCEVLQTFDSELISVFHEVLIDTFSRLPKPERSGYAGASLRVKKKLSGSSKASHQ